jgi:undecaprenyl-diphosphatase
MTILEAIFLGLVQGVTEFFPISSSGHLVIFQDILNVDTETSFYFSVFVHLATFFAVLFYFRQILINLVIGLFKKEKQAFHLFFSLVVATIPAVIVALTLNDFIDQTFSKTSAVLMAMFGTGIFFLIAEHFAKKITKIQVPTLLTAFIIGIVQSIAIIPGVSRSGSTLSAGLLTGLSREKAAEFSFLMALPAIFGAAIFATLDGLSEGIQVDWIPFIAGFIASFLAGYASISILMKVYQRYSLKVFAAYLVLMPIIVLIITKL